MVCSGRISAYPARSSYQLIIDGIEPAGEGALLKMLEERRKRLAAEGLLEAARKRPLPFLPQVIGVVTSPTGAVIRDILHRIGDRFPRRVLLWPVPVQGEDAAARIAAAIAGFAALPADGPVPRPDVLIVGRGGGSLEDLMPFNEEAVVRAIADCAIPVISAVGHETDTTLTDFAADHRAPTPTAAAERAVPVRADLLATVADLDRRQQAAAIRRVEAERRAVEGLARGLIDPQRRLELLTQSLDDRGERLDMALRGRLGRAQDRVADLGGRLSLAPLQRRLAEGQRQQAELARRLDRALDARLLQKTEAVAAAARLLETTSYRATLARGFVLVRDADGKAVTRHGATHPGQAVTLEFQDGAADAVIGSSGGRRSAKTKAAKAPPGGKPEQGSLL